MELLTACMYLFCLIFACDIGIRVVESACDISKIRIVGR